MEELQIGDQTIRYDRDSTLRVYAEIKSGGADDCECTYCWNFSLQRAKAYPESVLRIFELLGIDFTKEDEVYEINSENRIALYGGWLYFVGELIIQGQYLTSAGDGFQFHIVDAKRLPVSRRAFGEKVLAVDFTTTIPWIIKGEL